MLHFKESMEKMYGKDKEIKITKTEIMMILILMSVVWIAWGQFQI